MKNKANIAQVRMWSLWAFVLISIIYAVSFYFSPTVSDFNTALQQTISEWKSGSRTIESNVQELVFSEEGLLVDNKYFELPVLQHYPKSDTLFEWQGETYVVFQKSQQEVSLFSLTEEVQNRWVFSFPPTFQWNPHAGLSSLSSPSFPVSTKRYQWFQFVLWFSAIVWFLCWWSTQSSWKTWWVVPLVFFGLFYIAFPPSFSNISVFSSENNFGKMPFRNGAEAFFLAVVFSIRSIKSTVTIERAFLRTLVLAATAFLVQSMLLDTQWKWNFVAIQNFEVGNWLYLGALGCMAVAVTQPQRHAPFWVQGIAFFVVAGWITWRIGFDVLMLLGLAVCMGQFWTKKLSGWSAHLLGFVFFVGYLMHTFDQTKEDRVAKNSLILGHRLSDEWLEEELAFQTPHVQQHEEQRNFEAQLKETFQRKYKIERVLFSVQQQTKVLTTGVEGLFMENKPFDVPKYWWISAETDTTALQFSPINTGLGLQVWELPFVSTFRYLYRDGDCWKIRSQEKNCLPLVEWKGKEYRALDYTTASHHKLAVLIPKRSFEDWIGVYGFFLIWFLMFCGGGLFVAYREWVLSSYISKFTILQVALFGTLVAGVFVFIQYGISRFSDVQRSEIRKEKAASVLLELQSKFRNGIASEKALQKALSKFAFVFQTDLDLYTPAGKLWLSSTLGKLPHGVSLQIPKNQLSELPLFTKAEVREIESLDEVFGAWVLNEKPIAYLRVPYNKGDQLISEGIAQMQALISSGVFFLLLAILLGLMVVVRNRVLPITQLRKQLDSWEGSGKRLALKYRRKDEFGTLVDAMNKATALLAVQEKEGAWKGVAQQLAHEIKNPLTPMKLRLQMLPLKITHLDDEERAFLLSYVESTLSQIESLSTLAENFSNFARMPQPEFQTTTIGQTLYPVLEVFGNQATFTVQHEVLDALVVEWDKNQWIRIWNNLIKNAIQASTGIAEIGIEVKDGEEQLEIILSDKGSGIPPEKVGNIFEPNFTTKSGGTGLGLAMVKRMVEVHGGKITVQQTSINGTDFRIILPKKPFL